MKNKCILLLFMLTTLLTNCGLSHNLIKNERLSKLRFEVLEDFIEADLSSDLVVMHISDLHFERPKLYYKPILEVINEVNPDLLFITGDTIEYRKNFHLLEDFLTSLNGSIKKYAIFGNHEYWGDIDLLKLKELYEAHDCTVLRNNGEVLTLNHASINIYGTDDVTESVVDLSGFSPEKESLNFILTHCPVVFDRICKEFPDENVYVFSGHTHGGEITFFGKPFLLPRGSGDYNRGKYTNGSNTLYLSKGIGSGGILDMRVFAKRDVIVLRFSREKTD